MFACFDEYYLHDSSSLSPTLCASPNICGVLEHAEWNSEKLSLCSNEKFSYFLLYRKCITFIERDWKFEENWKRGFPRK